MFITSLFIILFSEINGVRVSWKTPFIYLTLLSSVSGGLPDVLK